MNDYNKQASGAGVQLLLCDRENVTEITSDCSLPDYQPEIKRLLRVSTRVRPSQKYVGTESVEVFGGLDFLILYAGNDGMLYSFVQSEDYRFAVPVEIGEAFDAGEGLSCLAEVSAEASGGRVAAPRRLSLKCRLRGRARLWGNVDLGGSIEGSPGASLERLCGTGEASQVFFGEGEVQELGDEILCSDGDGDLRVITSEGSVFVNEAVAGSGSVTCRGEVHLKLLCSHDMGGEPKIFLRRLPFVQEIPTEGVEVNCQASAHGSVCDLRVSVEEGRILCDASLCLRVRAQRNRAFEYVKDLYAVGQVCHGSHQSRRLLRAMRCKNLNFSLNSTLPLEEAGVRAGFAVVDASAVPATLTAELERERLVLLGKCRVHLLLRDGDEYAAQELELPFRYETDGVAMEDEVRLCDAKVEVILCRARVDGERIAVDAELAVALATSAEEEIRLLECARIADEAVEDDAALTICYPHREDTLWSVAKRYCKSVAHVSEQNGLSGAPVADSPDSLSGVRFLLI